MKNYEVPEMKIIEMKKIDIITTSGGTVTNGGNGNFGDMGEFEWGNS